jgi:hypothetical protein
VNGLKPSEEYFILAESGCLRFAGPNAEENREIVKKIRYMSNYSVNVFKKNSSKPRIKP